LVLHKVTGTLAVIDLNLQIYEAAGFNAEAWKELKEIYAGGRAKEKLKECQGVFYEHPFSLKRLYERESNALPEKEKGLLKSSWVRLTELFPEDRLSGKPSPRIDKLYLEVEEIIEGLDQGIEVNVRKNFEKGNLFREWMTSLEQAVNAIKEVVMENQNEPVGV